MAVKHIDVYAQLTTIKRQSELLRETDEKLYETLTRHFYYLTNVKITIEKLKLSLTHHYKPTNGQLIKALAELGFSNQHLAKIFALSSSNVSFHKNAPTEKHYRNIIWTKLYLDNHSKEKTNFTKLDYTFPEDYETRTYEPEETTQFFPFRIE